MANSNPNKKSKTDIKRELISTLKVQGLKNTEIAKRLGIVPQTVDKYVNNDEECIRMINEKFENIKELGMQRIKEVYLQQIENLIEGSLQDEDLNLKHKSTIYLIEMINGKPAQQQKIEATVDSNVTTINVNITDEE